MGSHSAGCIDHFLFADLQVAMEVALIMDMAVQEDFEV